MKYFICHTHSGSVYHLSKCPTKSFNGAPTHPALRTVPLVIRNLLRTHSPGLLVLLDRIDDVVFVQTFEEDVSGFIAEFSCVPIRGNETAIFGPWPSGFCLRRCRGTPEPGWKPPAHGCGIGVEEVEVRIGKSRGRCPKPIRSVDFTGVYASGLVFQIHVTRYSRTGLQ